MEDAFPPLFPPDFSPSQAFDSLDSRPTDTAVVKNLYEHVEVLEVGNGDRPVSHAVRSFDEGGEFLYVYLGAHHRNVEKVEHPPPNGFDSAYVLLGGLEATVFAKPQVDWNALGLERRGLETTTVDMPVKLGSRW